GGAGWSEGWRAGALPGVGWVLGPAWWVLGPARWAPGCRPRVGGRVGGVGAAEVAGPGLGEVFGDLDAGSVEVVDDGDNVAAGADAPPGPAGLGRGGGQSGGVQQAVGHRHRRPRHNRKSTRLNSSHVSISYAVFCLKKKINK